MHDRGCVIHTVAYLYRNGKECMSIKVSDTRPLPKQQEIFNQRSQLVKLLVAVALMVVVILNAGYVLPAPSPAPAETRVPTEAISVLTFKADADAEVKQGDPAVNVG